MRLNIDYFLKDEAVKLSVEWYRNERKNDAIYNMALILRSYNLDKLVTPEHILENLSK